MSNTKIALRQIGADDINLSMTDKNIIIGGNNYIIRGTNGSTIPYDDNTSITGKLDEINVDLTASITTEAQTRELVDDDLQAQIDYINSLISGGFNVPTGFMMIYPSNDLTIPLSLGFIVPLGQSLRKSDHPNLYNLIGDTFTPIGHDPLEFVIFDISGLYMRQVDKLNNGKIDINSIIPNSNIITDTTRALNMLSDGNKEITDGVANYLRAINDGSFVNNGTGDNKYFFNTVSNETGTVTVPGYNEVVVKSMLVNYIIKAG